MAYLITCHDKKNGLDLRLKTREEHLKYLNTIKNKIVLAGPILDDNENPKGTVLILDFDTLKQVNNFLKNDPYNKVELFENVNITRFKRVI